MDYKDEALTYLRRVMEETGKTATELARLADVHQTTFTRPLNSPDYRYAIKFQALQRLAQETGIPLPANLAAARQAQLPRPPAEARLPIRYEVAASGFLPRDDLPQRPYGYRAITSVAPYADHTQWLERVISDSMDRLIPQGAIIHVVDAVEIGYQARHGDVVVVERTRGQGSLVERTVKQVALTPKGAELWPRSHNPRWQTPIALAEGRYEDETVQIAGLVLRSYMFFTDAEAEETNAA